MNLKANFYEFFTLPDKALARLSIYFIKLYQATFSPDHSPAGKGNPLNGCKFYPSCSVYSQQVFEKHGFVTGLPRVLWRVVRCHPWSEGGVDEAVNSEQRIVF